jgi:hypothetical protein
MPSVVIEMPSVVIEMPSVVIEMPSVGIEMPSVGIEMPGVVIEMPSVVIEMQGVVIEMPGVGIEMPSVVIEMPSVVIEMLGVVIEMPCVVIEMPGVVIEMPFNIVEMPHICPGKSVVSSETVGRWPAAGATRRLPAGAASALSAGAGALLQEERRSTGRRRYSVAGRPASSSAPGARLSGALRAILGVLRKPLLAYLRMMSMNPREIPETRAARRFRMFFEERGKSEGLAEGKREGKRDGIVEGKREALLMLLGARGLAIPDDARATIAGCSDATQLDAWIVRAVTAASTDEALGTPARAEGAA